MGPMMMTGGFGARSRGINRSDKAKERNREQAGFCYNDFGLFFGIDWRAALLRVPAIMERIPEEKRLAVCRILLG
jgi:hypothetical protein